MFKTKSDEVQKLIQQGQWLTNAGRDRDAIKNFTDAISINPRSSRAYLARGLAYHALGQQAEALFDLDKCIEIEPEHLLAHLSRGSVNLALKNYPASIEDCNKTLSLLAWSSTSKSVSVAAEKPETAREYQGLAHLTCARAQLAMGNFEAAIARSSKSIELRGDNAEAYEVRAEAYKLSGQPQLSQEDNAKAKLAHKQQQSTPTSKIIQMNPGSTKPASVKDFVLQLILCILTPITNFFVVAEEPSLRGRLAKAFIVIVIAACMVAVLNFLGLGHERTNY